MQAQAINGACKLSGATVSEWFNTPDFVAVRRLAVGQRFWLA